MDSHCKIPAGCAERITLAGEVLRFRLVMWTDDFKLIWSFHSDKKMTNTR